MSAVRDWPRPKNLSELRFFLGLVSYYRRFIAGFADIAAQLHALQRKNVSFRWGQEQENAFNLLKERLTSAPVLGVPTDEGVYYLDNDASVVGLSSVLSQRQGEREVVIAYASRTLSKSERNYDVTKRELLAVVYGLKTYRQYLCGRRFVVRTDHSAIQWLRRTPEPMAQMARWLNFIEEFQFDIQHRSGARHGNDDGLSRRPADVSSDDGLFVRATDCLQTTSEPVLAANANTDAVGEPSLSEMQLNDLEIGFVLRSLLDNTERPDHNLIAAASAFVKLLCSQWELLHVVDGVLYRRFSYNDGRPDVLQLLVPFAMRKDFLLKVHACMNGGHLGIRRTLDQVRRRAFWPGWRGDVRSHCKQCQNCNEISGVTSHGRDPCSQCLPASLSNEYILTLLAHIRDLDAALCIL